MARLPSWARKSCCTIASAMKKLWNGRRPKPGNRSGGFLIQAISSIPYGYNNGPRGTLPQLQFVFYLRRGRPIDLLGFAVGQTDLAARYLG